MSPLEGDAGTLMRIIRARRSVRRGYTGARIAPSVLRDIIEAGVHAPSGSNSQAVRFCVVIDQDEIARLSAFRPRISPQASALVILLSKPRPGFWRRLVPQDAAAAIENMLLMATAHGVASCWFSAYAGMEGTERLAGRRWTEAMPGLSVDGLEPFGIVQLGYSTDMAGDETHCGRPVRRRAVEHYVLGSWI